MSRCLTVGLMQYEISENESENLKKIKKNVDSMMLGMNKPELIMGPELALGLEARLNDTLIGEFSDIARKYKIYFIPGSVYYDKKKGDETITYNSVLIFGPDGELIDEYDKICPYYPLEGYVTPGDKLVLFEIKEKNIKIGIMICHDWSFPEISRSLTLMGAELLLRPAVDPEGLYDSFRHVAPVRALENQAYFISLNACGRSLGASYYGHSMIVSPESCILYEADNVEVNICMTLDFDLVERTRKYGTFFTEQLLRQLKIFKFPRPFENMEDSPLIKNLPDPNIDVDSRLMHVSSAGLNTELGKYPL